MFIESFKVKSPNVSYGENEIQSVYNYDTTELVHENRKGDGYQWIVKPKIISLSDAAEAVVVRVADTVVEEADVMAVITEAEEAVVVEAVAVDIEEDVEEETAVVEDVEEEEEVFGLRWLKLCCLERGGVGDGEREGREMRAGGGGG